MNTIGWSASTILSSVFPWKDYLFLLAAPRHIAGYMHVPTAMHLETATITTAAAAAAAAASITNVTITITTTTAYGFCLTDLLSRKPLQVAPGLRRFSKEELLGLLCYFLQAGCRFCHPNNSVKTLKGWTKKPNIEISNRTFRVILLTDIYRQTDRRRRRGIYLSQINI